MALLCNNVKLICTSNICIQRFSILSSFRYMSLISRLLFNIIWKACQVCQNQRETITNLSFTCKIHRINYRSLLGERNKGVNDG